MPELIEDLRETMADDPVLGADGICDHFDDLVASIGLERGARIIAAAEIATATADEQTRRKKLVAMLKQTMHFCDAHEVDFFAILEAAQAEFLTEVDEAAL